MIRTAQGEPLALCHPDRMNLARLFARTEAAWNVAFVAHLTAGFVLATAVLVPFTHPLDTLIGSALAVLAWLVLWPRDRATEPAG